MGYAVLHILHTALHFLGFSTDERTCAYTSVMFLYGVETYLGTFIFISPFSSTLCRLSEFLYFFFVLFVFGNCKFIPALFVLPPFGKIAILNVYALMTATILP